MSRQQQSQPSAAAQRCQERGLAASVTVAVTAREAAQHGHQPKDDDAIPLTRPPPSTSPPHLLPTSSPPPPKCPPPSPQLLPRFCTSATAHYCNASLLLVLIFCDVDGESSRHRVTTRLSEKAVTSRHENARPRPVSSSVSTFKGFFADELQFRKIVIKHPEIQEIRQSPCLLLFCLLPNSGNS